ncbi:MAG: hypothetical protein ACFBWO_18055 [Paracoccaceae bacterium]
MSGSITILGETYRIVVDAEGGVLWRGDLMIFDSPDNPDCMAYMLCLPSGAGRLRFVNYVGYKAGAFLAVDIPKAAGSEGAVNLRLSWLRENWVDVMPIGRFEDAAFYAWAPGSG